MHKRFESLLEADEMITLQSGVSVFSLIITWLVIPVFCLPYFRTAAKYHLFSLFPKLPMFLSVLFSIGIALVILAWIGVCLVMTFRNLRNALAVTNHRVIGTAGGETVTISLYEIKNVFEERSVWGKIFGYGSVIVQTKHDTFTFQHINRSHQFKAILMPYAEKNSQTLS